MPHGHSQVVAGEAAQRALLNSYEIRLLIDDLVREQRIPLARILSGSGVTPRMLEQPAQRLTLEQELALYTRIARCNGDPSLGIRVGTRLNLPNYGILGSAMMAASSVGEALGLLSEFAPLVSWASHSTLTSVTYRRMECGRLTIFPTAADASAAALEIESTFASLQILFNELMGAPVQFTALQMSHRYGGADRLLYQQIFNCPVHFGCQHNTLLMPVALLASALPHPQPEYRELYRDLCRQAMSALTEDRGLVAAIRSRLQSAQSGMPSLEQLAAQFNLSSRTVRRQLRAAGFTYRGLLDDARYRQASRYLHSTDHTVESIARRLGYADARSFRTAFKRWAGLTPAAFRGAGDAREAAKSGKPEGEH